MKNWLKVLLAVSLILNVCLIIAVVSGQQYYRQTTFRREAQNAEAEARFNRTILECLKSENPAQIENTRTFLRQCIIESEKAAVRLWKGAK